MSEGLWPLEDSALPLSLSVPPPPPRPQVSAHIALEGPLSPVSVWEGRAAVGDRKCFYYMHIASGRGSGHALGEGHNSICSLENPKFLPNHVRAATG